MRIYLPLTAQDLPVLESSGRRLDLEVGRAAWSVTADAQDGRPGEDGEDLEYDALQDAVHVALSSGPDTARALAIAADVPDGVVEAATEDGGAFGIRLRTGCVAKIASFHVTELGAAAAEADDTDPALLWFDATEGRDALAFFAGGPAS